MKENGLKHRLLFRSATKGDAIIGESDGNLQGHDMEAEEAQELLQLVDFN